MRKLIYSGAVFLILFLLSTGFYSSYEINRLKAQVQDMEAEQQRLIMPADTGTFVEGYIIKDEEGYLYVYRGDGTTLYETTTIKTETLPEKIKTEVKKGKALKNELELYSFLENYSS